MTVDFICELLAEWFDSPCNYSPMDEQMFKDNYCESHCGKITDAECWKRYFEKMWADRKTESDSEKPNNCEHITEDGVTCAKYPACDDCLDNPLNKVKGSERLVKGSEQTEPTISKMEQVDEPKTQMKTQNSNLTFEKTDEPQTYVINPQEPTNDDKCFECDDFFTCGGQCNKIEDEPQTDCAWK